MNAPLHARRASALGGGLLMLLAGLLTAGPSRAAPPGIAQLLACRNIKADAARLRCFDRRSRPLALTAGGVQPASTPGSPALATPATPATPAATPSRAAAAAFDPHQTFGLSSSTILAREVASGARRERISSISTRITGLRTSSDGRMIYRFGNGQLWEELVADGEAPPVKTGDQVKVSRGWLGSYWMQTASGRGCKVQRLR